MASVEQGVSFIFCLVVDVWLVSKLHRNLLSRQVVIHILKDSFLFQCQRQDMVYKIKYRFFFIKCCDLRQSLQCGRQQRSSVICVLLPSFPSWWVRENFFQGRVQPLTLEKNSWYFFWPNQFLSEMASAKVFETGIPSLAILMLGASTLCQEILELPYLTVWAFISIIR